MHNAKYKFETAVDDEVEEGADATATAEPTAPVGEPEPTASHIISEKVVEPSSHEDRVMEVI